MSREDLANGNRFLTGHDDRAAVRPRRVMGTRAQESSTLTANVDAPRLARQITQRMCVTAQLSQDIRERAVLLTSELVTDAVLHSRGDKRLTVTTRSSGVRVEVGDNSTSQPTRGASSREATHDRGVQLLDDCADDWGSRATARGRCVWFDIHTRDDPVDRATTRPG